MKNTKITTMLSLFMLMAFFLPEAEATLSGKKIGLDPGHGHGVNPGVYIAEGTWVLDGAFRARTHMLNDAASVVMTRTDGSDPSLSTRVNILNSNNVHVAISLHSNAASSAAVGMEAYYCSLNPYPTSSRNLADKVRLRSLSMVHNKDRGTKECLDAGRGFHFYMVRYTNMPTTLPEEYFHTNDWENGNIHNTAGGRENVGKALYAGVCDYYGQTPVFGSTVVTVDNHHSAFSASGNWGVATWASDKHGPDYAYRSTQAISDAATWTGNLPSSGSYRVDAWWTQAANRATSAPYIVDHSGGSSVVHRNQTTNGGKWNSLGTYSFGAGNRTTRLSCWTSSGDVVIADAVRWVK